MDNSFVYITPDCEFVVESTSQGHGGLKHSFSTTKNANGASVFRTEKLTGTIGCSRAQAFNKAIPKYKAIAAKVTRTVELIL